MGKYEEKREDKNIITEAKKARKKIIRKKTKKTIKKQERKARNE